MNQYVACAGDWRASTMMLNFLLERQKLRGARTMLAGSGDSRTDSTCESDAYVLSLCFAGKGVVCEACWDVL